VSAVFRQSPAECSGNRGRPNSLRRWQPTDFSLQKERPRIVAEANLGLTRVHERLRQTLNPLMSIGLAFNNFHAGYPKMFPAVKNVLRERGVNEGAAAIPFSLASRHCCPPRTERLV